MKKKKDNTDPKTGRAKGIAQTSIAIPRELLEKIAEIADLETRSRNMQIQAILEAGVKDYWERRKQGGV